MSLTLCRVPDGQKKRAAPLALPIRILTDIGARVALQRCSILRVGSGTVTRTVLSPSTHYHSAFFISSGFLVEATIPISSGFLREAIRGSMIADLILQSYPVPAAPALVSIFSRMATWESDLQTLYA